MYRLNIKDTKTLRLTYTDKFEYELSNYFAELFNIPRYRIYVSLTLK